MADEPISSPMAARLPWIAVLTISLLGTAAPARPQSLAEVARQEAERRKAIKDSGKVITNRDLPSSPAPASGSAAATTKPATGTDTKVTADEKAAPAAKEATPKEPVKDQPYWAGRLKALQDQLDRDQTFADALQSRINGLTTDFVNRDDPAQRAVIATDRQKALSELERLKKAIIEDKKALTDFEEEARRAGVPPGWLR